MSPDATDPSDVRLERNLLVPLPDGAELAADLYLPAAGEGPFPTLLSFYPYRKDDLIGAAWAYPVRELAASGYAHLIVDFRGLGGSSGTASEAMSYAEAADGAAAVEWAAAQPWSDGNVGVWGVSYGGITAFQIASARPPHLRAIAPIYANLDTYHHFHYPGGCLNCLGAMGSWGPFMVALQLAPPTYQDPGGRWHEVWRHRLEHDEPYLAPWLAHPARDEFWQEKAIPAERIEVPTFLIGGWRDIFPEGMVRAYEQIRAPRKLWMGPWLHTAPDSSPFEAVEYVPELRRWFDRWLRSDRNGVDEEPAVTVYVQGHEPGWRHDRDWPLPTARETTLHLGAGGGLGAEPGQEEAVQYEADPTVGVQSALWDPKGTGIGLPLDQRPDDDRSLAFTSDPLPEALLLAGSPRASLVVALDAGEELNLVVKLCDVAPDGSSSLVTTGWLRGSHRLSHEAPSPVPGGEWLVFEVALWATAYRLAPGHRLRVCVSCADFPRIWPTRTSPRIRLATGGATPSLVRLPVVADAGVPGRDPMPAAPGVQRSPLSRDGGAGWRIERDVAADGIAVTTDEHGVIDNPGGDGRFTYKHAVRAAVRADAPYGARVEATTEVLLALPSGAEARIDVDARVTLDGYAVHGRVLLDGKPFFAKSWLG